MMTRKPKLTKEEKKIADLERLLARRAREIKSIRDSIEARIATIERKNKFTRFTIESIKKGEWPL